VALVEALGADHDVYVAAPDRPRSAMGQAVTLHKPLRAEPVTRLPRARAAWAINGTPSDCVKLAIAMLLDVRPDLVVSGINRGPNLGTDVYYSGTVSAAREGSLAGIPAAAFSLAGFTDQFYEAAGVVARSLVASVAALPAASLVNVNIPSRPLLDLLGLRVTRLGVRRYTDVFERREDPRGQTYFWLSGELEETEEVPDSDVIAVREGYISVTPIQHDLTCSRLLEVLRGLPLDGPTAAWSRGERAS
jgi:5'-nucleotidase